MGKTFVFANQKGGVGKTTSVINIGAYFAEAGKSVLLVDFDSQANLSSGLGAKQQKAGVYEVLAGLLPIEKAIRATAVSKLFVLPASIDLAGATVELMDENERDLFLRRALAPVRDRFDYVLIDCPPSLGLLTINGLTAADSVLIPMQCEYFAMEGLALLLQTIERIKSKLNPVLKIEGIFFTMYDSRTRLAQQVVKEVGLYFKNKVYSTIIPRNVRLSEAPSHGLPISRFDHACSGALAYESLCREIMGA